MQRRDGEIKGEDISSVDVDADISIDVSVDVVDDRIDCSVDCTQLPRTHSQPVLVIEDTPLPNPESSFTVATETQSNLDVLVSLISETESENDHYAGNHSPLPSKSAAFDSVNSVNSDSSFASMDGKRRRQRKSHSRGCACCDKVKLLVYCNCAYLLLLFRLSLSLFLSITPLRDCRLRNPQRIRFWQRHGLHPDSGILLSLLGNKIAFAPTHP